MRGLASFRVGSHARRVPARIVRGPSQSSESAMPLLLPRAAVTCVRCWAVAWSSVGASPASGLLATVQ